MSGYSNWGTAYAVNGVLALGEQIPGLTRDNVLGRFSGSSFATVLITAAAASLMSDSERLLGAATVRDALLSTAVKDEACVSPSSVACRRQLRGRLDLLRALQTLQLSVKDTPNGPHHRHRQER